MPKKKTNIKRGAKDDLILQILTGKKAHVKPSTLEPRRLAKDLVGALAATELQNDSPILREHLANNLLGFVTETMLGDSAKCHEFLDELGNNVSASQMPDSEWWQAHIYLMRTIKDQASETSDYDKHKMWQQMLERGRAAKNAIAMYTAVNTITFGFSHYTKGFGDLAGMQKELLEILDAREPDPETLALFGQDLFDFWSKADYKRISERDLAFKRNLMEGAQTLKVKKVPKAAIPSMMVLLLAASYGYHGKSTEWAVKQVKTGKVLSEVKELVGQYFG